MMIFKEDALDLETGAGICFLTEKIPVKQYITSGIIRYFASLDRKLFRWYQRAKKTMFKGEDK